MTDETQAMIQEFVHDRHWEDARTPATMAKSILLEAAELLEIFQWDEENYDLEHLKEELADVLIYSAQLCYILDLDMDEIVRAKIDKNIRRWPLEDQKTSQVSESCP